MPLQRSEWFPSVSPSLHPTLVGRTPSLSDCSLRGRPCPLVTILSRCLPALRLTSSAGYANWPTSDKCIKVDSDYNWSLRINYTGGTTILWLRNWWLRLCSITWRRDRWSWKIPRSASITIAIFLGNKIWTFVTQCHMHVHRHASAHTPAYH